MSEIATLRWHHRAVVALAISAIPALTGHALAFSLTSATFKPGATIPVAQTCDAPMADGDRQTGGLPAGISPQLSWDDPPPGTNAFALLVDDPDAPGGSWVHWILYDIPTTSRSLAEGVAKTPTLADGSRQGRNSFGNSFYQGPCPPPGRPHRYVFTLYALDAATGLTPGATKSQFLKAISDHTRGKAELIGRFGH